jgi:hypothetical protein
MLKLYPDGLNYVFFSIGKSLNRIIPGPLVGWPWKVIQRFDLRYLRPYIGFQRMVIPKKV